MKPLFRIRGRLSAWKGSSGSGIDVRFAAQQPQSASSNTFSTRSPSSYASSLTFLITRPGALLRRPSQVILRAPRAVLRAPGTVTRRGVRLFSNHVVRRRDRRERIQDDPIASTEVPHASTSKASPVAGPSTTSTGNTTNEDKRAGLGRASPSLLYSDQALMHLDGSERLKNSWQETPVKWFPIPVSLGIAVLVVLNFYKGRSWEQDSIDSKGKSTAVVPEDEIKIKGPWQVHVIGALPLKTISRLYGAFNNVTLPVWFRVPGFKLYAFIFGVNLDECEPSDLREYRSMSEFFMRKLKPGMRPVDPAQLVRPSCPSCGALR